MKFIFKTKQPTGRYRAFEDPIHYIKLKGKEVGTIDHEKPHYIRLAIEKNNINEDGNPNCPWKWIRLKAEFTSL